MFVTSHGAGCFCFSTACLCLSAPGQTNSASYLLDLQFGSSVPTAATSASSTAACPPSTCSSSSLPGDNAAGDISLLDDTLGSLGEGVL